MEDFEKLCLRKNSKSKIPYKKNVWENNLSWRLHSKNQVWGKNFNLKIIASRKLSVKKNCKLKINQENFSNNHVWRKILIRKFILVNYVKEKIVIGKLLSKNYIWGKVINRIFLSQNNIWEVYFVKKIRSWKLLVRKYLWRKILIRKPLSGKLFGLRKNFNLKIVIKTLCPKKKFG